MALKLTQTTNFGITVTDAYLRVENVIINSKIQIAFHLGSYVNPNNLPSFTSRSFVCSYDIFGDNPIKQAYLYVKSLPEYADAVDC